MAADVGPADAMPPDGRAAYLGLLDKLAESVLVLAPVRDSGGRLTDFAMAHVSPGYVCPAGGTVGGYAGQTLLAAYPHSAAAGGLFARAAQVLADGAAQYVPGPVGPPLFGPLTGDTDIVQVSDLRAARHAGQVVFTWRARTVGEDSRLAALLDHVQRVGRVGGWEENLETGAVRWTEAAFAVFGLDPVHAAPVPLAELPGYVFPGDRELVQRFRQSLLEQREPAAAVFRVSAGDDRATREIRVFAEPVLAAGEPLLGRGAAADAQVTALRGAFQDVSAQFRAQAALATTRDLLADSEQRAAEEHELAVRLQRAIMPSGLRQVDTAGVEIAVRYRPAQARYLVAGDWYDVLPLPGGELLVVIGDIAGHGIDAVTGMVAARNALRGLAVTGGDPHALLSGLNYAACLFTEGVTGTALCGRYDPKSQVLRWARAGHLPPVLVREGVATVQPAPEGLLLGVDLDTEYEEVSLQLRSGDTLLLYTDGLIERRAASISDALAEFAAAAVPVGPDADSHAARILAGAASDTGDDACLLAIRIP